LQYDIDRIEEHGCEPGFIVSRPSVNEVAVTIFGEAVLAFRSTHAAQQGTEPYCHQLDSIDLWRHLAAYLGGRVGASQRCC